MTLDDASRGVNADLFASRGLIPPLTVIGRHGVMDCRTLREELATTTVASPK